MVSYHAHHGPVKFLVTAAAPRAGKEQPADGPPPGADPAEEDRKEAALGEGAVWLGGELSGSSGSLEPRPEDSALQDLLRHPGSPPGGGRRPRRARVGSVLVACGGQGHRRVGRRPRQARPEELASALMVWQIPLPHV